jgi:hypothetical protein
MPHRSGTVGRAATGLDAHAGRGQLAGASAMQSRTENTFANSANTGTSQSHLDVAATVARVREFCLQMKSRGRTRK